MNECIFCKIVKGEIPCFKILENDNFMAILDIQPNCEGQTLVISKKHYPSYVFDLPEDVYHEMLDFIKLVIDLLKNKLQVQRVGMIVEGMGVNHAHVKLYPMHGLSNEWQAGEKQEEKFYKTYPGFLTSATGMKADVDELKRIYEKLLTK